MRLRIALLVLLLLGVGIFHPRKRVMVPDYTRAIGKSVTVILQK